jgi:hypothetical protein
VCETERWAAERYGSGYEDGPTVEEEKGGRGVKVGHREIWERLGRGEEEKKRGGSGGLRGFFPFSLLFQILFNTNLLHLFNSNFHKFSQTFSQLFLGLFHKYFKTLKPHHNQNLMHTKMMRKHLGDSNYFNVV